MADIRDMLRGTAAPQVTDDSSQGYVQGSTWNWNGLLYLCRAATVGAAEWVFVGDEEAHASTHLIWPSHANGMLVDGTPGTTFDILGYFPFRITRPILQAGLYLRTAGSTGAQVSLGLNKHDRTTMKAGSRIANFGTINLDGSTGLMTAGSTTLDFVPGLYWVSVHLKLIGLTTAPTFVRMNGSNGRHIHRSNGADLSALTGYQAYTSHDTYTVTPPSTPPTTSAVNEILPMPVLKAA